MCYVIVLCENENPAQRPDGEFYLKIDNTPKPPGQRRQETIMTPRMPPFPGVHATLCGAALLALSGCAPLSEQLPAGTSYAAVTQKMGKPTVTCPLPDGGQRAVWSGQPLGQASWATNVAPDGTTTGIEQVLTDAAFLPVRAGTGWDMERVMCTFGPPAERGGAGVPGHVQRVWSYAYKQDGVWNSLMHIFFDAAGQVTRAHPGPDLAYEPEPMGI